MILKRLWFSSYKGRDYIDLEIILLWIIYLIFVKGGKGKGKCFVKINIVGDGEFKFKKVKNMDIEFEEFIEDG